VQVHHVELDQKGHVKLDYLESLLKSYKGAIVSLMHANNEIGNLLDIERVSQLCEEHDAFFHSDTVQTMGHYPHDTKSLKACGMTGSAHKLNGPKGIGFMYIRKDRKIHSFIQGGAQERNMRGGTENVYGIVGMAKAMEIAYRDMGDHHNHIASLKSQMIEKLKQEINGVDFNGDSANLDRSLYTVLNVSLPESEENEMLLFNLDLHGISASGGSACSSGATTGSHVLAALYPESKRGAVRFSFGKYNTPEQIDFTVGKLAEMFRITV
jgi:cysteine desulfurase